MWSSLGAGGELTHGPSWADRPVRRDADGRARQFAFTMEAKSVITPPAGGQGLGDRGYQQIRGITWSRGGRVERVDVSIDVNRSWRAAL